MAEPGSGYTSSQRFYGELEKSDTTTRLQMIIDITKKEGINARGPLESVRNLARGGDPWLKAVHAVTLGLVANEPDRIKQELEEPGYLDRVSMETNSHDKLGAEAGFMNKSMLESCYFASNSKKQDCFTLNRPLSSDLKASVLHQQELSDPAHPLSRSVKHESHGPVTLPAYTRQPSRRQPSASNPVQRPYKKTGTKLIDLSDVPTKRRRKTVDAEALKQQGSPTVESSTKKVPPTPSVPEYAAGLSLESDSISPVIPPLESPAVSTKAPIPPKPATPTVSSAPLPTPKPPSTPQVPTTVRQPHFSPTQINIAEEMFREAPGLSLEQKRMIAAFLAGVTDNPNPEGKNVVTVPLTKAEKKEPFLDSTSGQKGTKVYSIETVFEMNYGTGQWRKLQLKRLLRTESN